MSEIFEYLIAIEPLGFLYGSAGRFLSPDNLVGRSGTSFPPSAATLSGLYAAGDRTSAIDSLQIAGPFWAKSDRVQNFYIPTPFNCLVEMEKYTQKGEIPQGKIKYQSSWHEDKQQWLVWEEQKKDWILPPSGKFKSGTWIAIQEWLQPQQVRGNPWEYLPHLHPRLQSHQRITEQGDLFLENAVQMHPDTCLIYLANMALPDGWYRFGGEGHLVEVRSLKLDDSTQQLLNQPVGKSFAAIAPALWGSNRLSYREPKIYQNNTWESAWQVKALLTERPITFRYRLGGTGKTKRLSRGRYAVPAGSVYILEKPQESWQKWCKSWFPKEAYSFKRWGCGLALPLPGAIASQETGFL